MYGGLADSCGRRPIYAMALVGMILNYDEGHFWNIFPIQAVWLTSLFRAIGGGTYVILALNMTMVADLCSDETRYGMPLMWILL